MSPIPAPRLCCLARPASHPPWGFQLTGRPASPGRCLVSAVEADSPAARAGLRLGDRLVEVEGEHVGLENHWQVVARVERAGERVKLLVVDPACDEVKIIYQK